MSSESPTATSSESASALESATASETVTEAEAVTETEAVTEAGPVTAVVLVGSDIFFKPQSEAITATTTAREELATCLDSKAEKASIGTFHIIMKANSVPTLFDPDAIKSFATLLLPGAEVYAHILSNPGEEYVDIVKMALVLADLRIVAQQPGEGGSEILISKYGQ